MHSVTSTIATNDSHNEIHRNINKMNDTDNNIKVAVRIRRFLPNEAGEKCIHILTTPSHPSPIIQIGTGSSVGSFATNGSASISGLSHNSSSTESSALGGKSFFFDQAFNPETKQKNIFQQSIRPLVEACLKGYNATVLAYGQTGSGKTYTILGPSAESFVAEEVHSGSALDSQAGSQGGVIPRALRDLFNRLETTRKKYQLSHNVDLVKNNKKGEKPYDYEVRVQFLELYGEEIRDLLSTSATKLVIRDGGMGVEPEVIGASEVRVHSAEEALLCLTRGTLRRVTGATAMNSESSRSHAIMTVIVEQTTVIKPSPGANFSDNSTTAEDESTTSSKISNSSSTAEVECKRSKFHFVDLAGCERQKRSLAQGKRLREGIDINKGLLVLGNVISALGDPKKRGKSFVPYRDSKLTRLLKGSLGGNHKTLMIACVSPSSINLEESLNCLRYANRAKNIKNNAVINLDAGSRLVAQLRAQLKTLAIELLGCWERDGQDSSTILKTSDLRLLANGVDTPKINFKSFSGLGSDDGENMHKTDNKVLNHHKEKVKSLKIEVAKLASMTTDLKSALVTKCEELFASKAEVEYYRLGGVDDERDGNNTGGNSKANFVHRVREYESEIANLKEQLRLAKLQPLCTKHDGGDSINKHYFEAASNREGKRDSSPTIATGLESSENGADIRKITKKYLRMGKEDIISIEDDADDDGDNERCGLGNDCQSVGTENDHDEIEDEDETFMSRQSILDSHMIQLSKGIAAKEELIDKLERSQTKYEKMKSFYQEKLQKMTIQLSVQEAERVNLEVDLKKHKGDNQKYKDLHEKLQAKQKHIEHLKKRQMEIKNLTSIASRNDLVISSLTKEIDTMKKQKDELQQQLNQERKEHARSLHQLRKRAGIQQKGVTRIRHQLAVTIAQKERAQDIAKARADKITELRSKYKGAEKKLRMQTLKRGMMERAGIDPVLVGQHAQRNIKKGSQSPSTRVNGKRTHGPGDIYKMRTLLEDKIADISRKETAADKLACEWEDHLELTERKRQISVQFKANPNDSNLTDELEALDFQIKYKESRIRQLAHRLGKKPAQHDKVVDDEKFISIMSELPPLAASQLASKVLFGMVVRERRRVAALARAASTLDQKAIEAQRLATSKENTIRSLVEESKNERMAMAQHQQDKILSLMEIVQREEKEQDLDEKNTNIVQCSRFHESVVLQLANERIEALETQLSDLHTEKQTRETYQAREAETVTELTQLTKDYEALLKNARSMRGCLRKIRCNIDAADEDNNPTVFNRIAAIVDKSLKTISQSPHIERVPDTLGSDLDDEDDSELPDWAGHIMKDLAIIAAGEVPASLKTPSKQNRPPTPSGNIFDRLSSPDNFTVSHHERVSDNHSVASNTASQRSTSRARVRSTSRTRYITPTQPSVLSIQRSDTEQGFGFGRKSYTSSPPRQKSPDHSRTRITDRISAILKDGPPRVLTLQSHADDDDRSLHSFKSLSSQSQRSNRSQKGNSSFVEAYTKKDVFERLQKKHTNSFTLNIQASHSFGENCGR